MERKYVAKGDFEASTPDRENYQDVRPLRKRTGYELAEIYRTILEENPDAQMIFM